MKLRTKFALLLSTTTLLPLAIVVLLASRVVTERFDLSFQRGLRENIVLIQDECERLFEDARAKTRLFSQNIDLKRILLLRQRQGEFDQLGLIELVERLMVEGGLDLLVVSDEQGVVLARGHQASRFGDKLSEDEIGKTLLGEETSGVYMTTSGEKQYLSLMATLPLTHRENLIGIISGGYLLDERFLEGIKKKSQAEVFLIYRESTILSTLGNEPLPLSPELKEELKKGLPYLGKACIGGESYSLGGIPLGEDTALFIGFSRRELVGMLRELRWMFVILAILGGGVAVVIGFIMAKGITGSVQDLVQGAKRIAQGELDYNIQTNRQDELGFLIHSFNSMAKDLKASREALLRAERIAAWRDIARRIAHEIKNPLTPIQLSIQSLQRGLALKRDGLEEEFKEASQTILDEVASLKKIADEFSNFARLPEPKREPNDINEIIRGVTSLYSTCPGRVEIELELEDDLPQISVDRDQMREVFTNLIKNGLEAMQAGEGVKEREQEAVDSRGQREVRGGRLTVRSKRLKVEGKEFIQVSVEDTGPGVKDEDKERIFDPFFTTKAEGTGLGLAIVHRIIQEHGGRIDCRDNPQGGAVFSIRLPVEQMGGRP